MPDIGKWNGIDQLAESYLSASPYAYVLNNPINMFDPDGRETAPWSAMWEATPDGTNSYWFNDGRGFTSYDGGGGGGSLPYSSHVSYGGAFTMGDWTYAMPPIVLSGNKSGWADQFRDHMEKYAGNTSMIAHILNLNRSGVPEIRQSYHNFNPYQPDNTPEWYSFGGRGNWGIATGAASLEHFSGLVRVTTTGSSIKLYRPNANGNVFIKNAYTKTTGLSKIGKTLGKYSFYLGVAMDVYGVKTFYEDPNSPNAVHPGKGGLNTVMGYVGLKGGAYGAIISILYFGVDNYYPGGWVGASETAAATEANEQQMTGHPFLNNSAIKF